MLFLLPGVLHAKLPPLRVSQLATSTLSSITYLLRPPPPPTTSTTNAHTHTQCLPIHLTRSYSFAPQSLIASPLGSPPPIPSTRQQNSFSHLSHPIPQLQSQFRSQPSHASSKTMQLSIYVASTLHGNNGNQSSPHILPTHKLSESRI